jgi:hypothetical protein
MICAEFVETQDVGEENVEKPQYFVGFLQIGVYCTLMAIS